MASLRLRVTATDLVTVEKENYRDQYEEHCAEEGKEYDPSAEVPDDFVMEAYTHELEEGELDLSEVLEGASISVDTP